MGKAERYYDEQCGQEWQGNPETFGARGHMLYAGRKAHCQRDASGL